MKKASLKKPFLALWVCGILCLSFLGPVSGDETPGTSGERTAPAAVKRGLLVSMIQEPYVLSSREDMVRLLEHARADGIDTIYVQVYRANQSWFPSAVADDSPYRTGAERVGEDPFAVLLREARGRGIRIYAWLNLLSLSKNENAPLLKKYGPEILTRNLKEKKALKDYQIDNQYFLEPGDPRVREELTVLVGELLGRYPSLDGILFDYIRYPDQRPHYGFTERNLSRFKAATGLKTVEEDGPSWKKWKRDQVDAVLKQLVEKTKQLRPDISIAATGCMAYSRAYHEAFQNWPSWLETGLVDSVMIMSYTKRLSVFIRYVTDTRKRVKDFKKVHAAVGAYELGDAPEKFARQMSICEMAGGASCVIFHYESLLEHPALEKPLAAGEKP